MNYLLDLLQFLIFLGVLTFLAYYIGNYFYKVVVGERSILTPIFNKPEKLIYKIFRIDENERMSGKTYLWSVLAFSFISFFAVLLMQLFQQYLHGRLYCRNFVSIIKKEYLSLLFGRSFFCHDIL